MSRTRRLLLGAAAALLFGASGPTLAQNRFILMASTTSTEQSGLFAVLLPAFTKTSGIDVRVVAVGTGQAIDMARRGDADLLFVHDQVAEEKFVDEGFGLSRRPVMYNDFVLIGPTADPAGARGKDLAASLTKLAASTSTFISRGDRSGTHTAELRDWQAAGIADPAAKAAGRRLEYRECGCGMGQALNIASSSDAYVLADRGTWLAFRNRGKLAVLVEGDTRLFNQYGVIVVNPARFPHTKTEMAQAFSDWVVSPAGQSTIAGYRINGEQSFFPNARP